MSCSLIIGARLCWLSRFSSRCTLDLFHSSRELRRIAMHSHNGARCGAKIKEWAAARKGSPLYPPHINEREHLFVISSPSCWKFHILWSEREKKGLAYNEDEFWPMERAEKLFMIRLFRARMSAGEIYRGGAANLSIVGNHRHVPSGERKSHPRCSNRHPLSTPPVIYV